MRVIGSLFKGRGFQVKSSLSADSDGPPSSESPRLFVDLSGRFIAAGLGSPAMFASTCLAKSCAASIRRTSPVLRQFGLWRRLMFELPSLRDAIHGFPSGSKTATLFFWGKGNRGGADPVGSANPLCAVPAVCGQSVKSENLAWIWSSRDEYLIA